MDFVSTETPPVQADEPTPELGTGTIAEVRFNSPYFPVVGREDSDGGPDSQLQAWEKWMLLLGGILFGFAIGINLAIIAAAALTEGDKFVMLSASACSVVCLGLSSLIYLKSCRMIAKTSKDS